MKNNIENTFVMIKPDGVAMNIVPEVIKRLYENDLLVADMKSMKLPLNLVDEHYAHIKGRDFYPEMKKFMTSGNVVAMIVNGEDAVSKVRIMMGPTLDAPRGTIRGDYASKTTTFKNVIHGSDSIENANIEIARFFDGLELENNKRLASKFTKTKRQTN